jgi:hypothetical protein
MKTLMLSAGLFVLLMLIHTTTASADAVVAVPEPVSFSMVGVALASLAGYKLYRKRR